MNAMNEFRFPRHFLKIALLFGLLPWLVTCTQLKQKAVKKPRISLLNARVTALNFSRIDLEFDLEIDNPNPIGIQLKSFRYDLSINHTPFLQGDRQSDLRIPAHRTSAVTLPLSIPFDDLYRLLSDLKNRDSAAYRLRGDFSVQLPVLGTITVPFHQEGKFPLLHVPTFRVLGISVRQVGFGGADLELNVQITNPNAFAFTVADFTYRIKLAQMNWIRGKLAKPLPISARGRSVARLPLHVNFARLGPVIQQIMRGKERLTYRVEGMAEVKTDYPLLPSVTLPLNFSGETKLSR